MCRRNRKSAGHTQPHTHRMRCANNVRPVSVYIPSMRRFLLTSALLVTLLPACGSSSSKTADSSTSTSSAHGTTATTQPNVYAKDGANQFVDATRNVPYRLYVPNSDETSMMVVDPSTQKVIDT